MRNSKTDIEAVKSVARSLIYFDPIPDPILDGFINHPYTYAPYVYLTSENRLGNIIANKEDLDIWRKLLNEQINEANTVSQIITLIYKPYRFGFLKQVYTYISPDELGTVLRETWQAVEFISNDPNITTSILVRMFNRCNPHTLMSPEELGILEGLPSEVNIYRGTQSSKVKYIKQLSWTINIEVARWYKGRFNRNLEESRLYTTTINKKEILSYFKQEQEVIINPSKLIEIIELE